MTNPTLLVLAAGMGNRYGGLKQIEPVGPSGEIIIDYSIFDARQAGFGKVVFVIRKDIEEAFKTTIASRFQAIELDYVFQEVKDIPARFQPPASRSKPWGTSQAVLAASKTIHEPFAVINADDFYGCRSFDLLARHLMEETPDYAMAGFVLRNTLSEYGTVARGICKSSHDNYLEHVVELTGIERVAGQIRNSAGTGSVALTGDEIVSMNMWGFRPAIFDQIQQQFEDFLESNVSSLKAESYLPNVVDQLIQSRQAHVKILHTPESWFGVTYHQDREHVVKNIKRLVANGVYPKRLEA